MVKEMTGPDNLINMIKCVVILAPAISDNITNITVVYCLKKNILLLSAELYY